MVEKSLKENAFFSMLGEFITLLFPLITFPYASRILLPDGIGIVNFVNSIVSYFLIFASLGISTYGIREIAKIRNDKLAMVIFFKEVYLINFICSIIAYILFIASLFIIPKFYEYRNLLLICSIKILIATWGFDWFFSAMEDFAYLTTRSFIFKIISIAYLFIFVRTKDDIGHYVFFGLINTIGAMFCNILRINKYIDIKIKIKYQLKRHVKPIIVFFGMTLVTSIYNILDSTMLGFLSTNTELGYYSASTKLSHMVLSVLAGLTAVLLPRLSSYISKNDMTSFNEICKKCACIISLLGIPISFGLFLLSKPFILLLTGQNYMPAITVMQMMTPIVVIISFGSLIGVQILPALGKENISLISYIVGATINIILNAILIPKFGAFGAAIGTVCAEFSVTSIQLFFVRKIILTKDFVVCFFQSIVAGLLMILPIYQILRYFSNSILQIFISFISGLFVYSLFLFLNKNKIFIEYCKKLSNKILKK